MNAHNFFAIGPILEIFMGEINEILYFLSPRKKRVKKVPKKVYLDLDKTFPKFLKIEIFLPNQIYHTPFTLFTTFAKNLKK